MPTGHGVDTPTIAVLGAGSWGTALAALIARHGHPVVLWGRDAAIRDAINATHENPRYLPGTPLPPGMRASTDLADTLQDARLVLVVVPSHAFAWTLRALAPLRPFLSHLRRRRCHTIHCCRSMQVTRLRHPRLA